MRRALRPLLLALLALAAIASTASAVMGHARTPAALPASYPDSPELQGRAWTYDAAVLAAGDAVSGETAAARRLVDALAARQNADGSIDGSFDGRRGDGFLRAGNVAWAGLAAMQLRAATCDPSADALATGAARWLLSLRGGSGLVRGGPDVAWSSTEHNLEARALFAALLSARTGCPDAPDPADGLRDQLAAAVAGLDDAIASSLYVPGPDAHFRQGLDDDARPLDVQALGALWLAGQGRRGDAVAVLETADRTLAVSGRHVGSAGPFSGYKPAVEADQPDVLWMEGTLQMRAAKAALGLDTSAIDDSVARWARLSPSGTLLQADRDASTEMRRRPALAPAAWRLLAAHPPAMLM